MAMLLLEFAAQTQSRMDKSLAKKLKKPKAMQIML